MVKVFYHNDPDGWCSGFLVRMWLEKQNIAFTVDDFIEMNYDKQFPWDILTPGEQVFMVDFSLNNPMDMIKLATDYDFTWIDHHKTAIDKMNAAMDLHRIDINGIRYDGIAACALTWIYFQYDIGDPSLNYNDLVQNMPLYVQFIHLWDTWQWKDHLYRGEIEPFVTALMSMECHPMSPVWDELSDDAFFALVIKKGSHMIDFRDGYGETLCKSIGKIIEFEGHRCFVCNMPKCNSEWFKSVDESSYDILMPFYYNAQTEQFCVSLYSSSVDVSKIAVKLGGGGHQNASGFQCKELPF